MSSFFGKLKSNTDNKGANTTSNAKQKPDPNAPQFTPLERMLQNAGPIRHDGSDKFWGMENFGNTCYCNSILQALYYSVPFRENIVAYPQRSTVESINAAAASATPRPKFPPANSVNRIGPQPANRNGVGPTGQAKPEDKDSPEYKKKQALIAGPILNMSYQNAPAYSMPESLYTSVKDLFEAIISNSSRHGVISPSKLVEVLRRDNEMFRGQIHQDAHEFFNLLLNTLLDNIDDHEKRALAAQSEAKNQENSVANLEPPNENATVSFPSVLPIVPASPTKWLRDMFEGTITSETRCLTCENISQRDEPFLDLSVDLEQHTSVTACLRRFSEEEMLCERNKFHCDNCGGLQEAEKRMKIKRLPRVLAMHLKRFKYTEDFGRLQKLFHKVVYPYYLRLFNTTDDAEDPDRLYELYAVVVHIGNGPFHGHYVAVIKTQDRGWLLFDDEMVEPVDRSYVQNFFGDKPGQATAYVLFYQETTIEAVRAEQRREKRRRASQDCVDNTMIKTKDSVELHRVQTVSPTRLPVEVGDFSRLDHAMTAPPMHANGHVDRPQSPISPSIAPLIATPLSKKEKAKEDKERKAAEKAADKQAKKDKEREDKDKRASLHDRLAQVARQNADQMKSAIDESKKTFKDDEEKRKEEPKILSTAEETGSNGVSLGLDRFKRSKSLRFGSIGKKDKKFISSDENATNSSAVDDSPAVSAESPKDKDKKNRFSIRKKSFGVLNNS